MTFQKRYAVTFLYVLLLTAFFVLSAYADQTESAASFASHSLALSETENINYWLFTPKNATAEMPLIVYLHGGSGRGDDIGKLTNNGFCMWVSEGKFDDVPAYIVFPQLASKYKAGWSANQTGVQKLIESLVKNYKIDTDRISLVGHSMGGTGTLAVASAFPRLFSCIMPMSGTCEVTDKTVSALSALPIRAFIGSADTIVKPENSMQILDAVKAAGGEVEACVFEGADHFSVPELAFLDEKLDVVSWLICHKKQTAVTAYDADSRTLIVRTQIPGTYTFLFASYAENGALLDVKIYEQTLAFGLESITLPVGTELLQKGGRIFLWRSLAALLPACPAFAVEN